MITDKTPCKGGKLPCPQSHWDKECDDCENETLQALNKAEGK